MSNYNEVPMEYRRNYGKELINLLAMCGLTLVAIAYISFMIINF
jgi:hypothetical protein